MKTEIKPVGYSPNNQISAIEEVKKILDNIEIPLNYRSILPVPDAYGVVIELAVYAINFVTILKLMEVSQKYGLIFNTIESNSSEKLIITMATSYNQIDILQP